MLLRDASWDDIDQLRKTLAPPAGADTLERAAQHFVATLAQTFSSVVLARLFVVLPFARLPEAEQAAARAALGDGTRVTAKTRVLSLLGTAGQKPEWSDRTKSQGHRAIPLLDASFVNAIPMLSKLLAEVDVDLSALDTGQPIATRSMLGGRNGMFYVGDAQSARDAQGRLIIANREFALANGVHTVFGMGGAYVDDTLAIAIVFTTETLPRLTVDRFPSLISNFKMSTAARVQAAAIYEPAVS